MVENQYPFSVKMIKRHHWKPWKTGQMHWHAKQDALTQSLATGLIKQADTNYGLLGKAPDNEAP